MFWIFISLFPSILTDNCDLIITDFKYPFIILLFHALPVSLNVIISFVPLNPKPVVEGKGSSLWRKIRIKILPCIILIQSKLGRRKSELTSQFLMFFSVFNYTLHIVALYIHIYILIQSVFTSVFQSIT